MNYFEEFRYKDNISYKNALILRSYKIKHKSDNVCIACRGLKETPLRELDDGLLLSRKE
jgi:hypothetical protein